MRTLHPPIAIFVIASLLVVACGAAPSPTPGVLTPPSPTARPALPSFASGSSPSVAPSGAANPSPGAPATAGPSRAPSATGLPIRGSAREISTHPVQMAAAPGGGLFAYVPSRDARASLFRLDKDAALVRGWPVELTNATWCGAPLPADDGSVRIICTLASEGNMFDPIEAFAFDASGRPIDGWPVRLDGFKATGRMVGSDLVVLLAESLGDVIPEGEPSFAVRSMSISPGGSTRSSDPIPMDVDGCCTDEWVIAPDGIAYGTSWGGDGGEPSRLLAVDLDGIRPGWPASMSGVTSLPAFEPAGAARVTIGSRTRARSHVLVFLPDGDPSASKTQTLPMQTVQEPDTGGCTAMTPRPPVLGPDGTMVVISEIDTSIHALAGSLEILRGWPYEPATPLERIRPGFETEREAGFCPELATPVFGPDGTLYAALHARNGSTGGSIVAIAPDGRVGAGWPVGLRRAGGEFWSIIVGDDRTIWALAIEPEGRSRSSATILAIEPNSRVRATTTIIEPG